MITDQIYHYNNTAPHSLQNEDEIEKFISDFAYPTIFSSVNKDSEYFIKNASVYYKEIDNSTNAFLDPLDQPTEKNIDTLLKKISEGRTSIKFRNNPNESLKLLRELAETKTGYYIISKAIHNNVKIHIALNTDKSNCKQSKVTLSEFFVFLVKIYLFFILYPITIVIKRELSIVKYFGLTKFDINLQKSYNNKLTMINEQGTIKPSSIDPKMVLLHELAHTFDRNKMHPAYNHLTFLEQMDNREEMKAIMYENAYFFETCFADRRISDKPYIK